MKIASILNHSWKALLAASALWTGVAQAASDTRLVLPDDVVPRHYALDLRPDAAHLTFTGTATIDIEVLRPTRAVVLNAADLAFSEVTLDDGRGSPEVSFDKEQQTATLAFPTPLKKGKHILTIAYAGAINENAAGLFALDYGTGEGKKRALYTNFEPADARRFLPCWDEPGRKATFALTAIVPAAQMAISNMPVVATEALPNDLQRVRFATTPKMSSYLLFFALGDFERIHRKVDGVDVGIVVKRGDTGSARYALDAAAELLPYYQRWFSLKYPLPKLDFIAAPGQSQLFGAMENWGAILHFEQTLLVDPRLSAEWDKAWVYTAVAHEMAHQWFGNLVTMAWWDDLWLNEGFATWVATKASDHFHPGWKVWDRKLREIADAMSLDARAGTHPIVQPIRDALQAEQTFDGITYQKGAAVVRMLEGYLGEDIFRSGVRRYLKAHAYGNAVSDDLWRELDKASNVPVTRIAHDFTLQAGVPLIRAKLDANRLRLSQDRFAADDTGKEATRWQVPVVARSPGAEHPWHGLVQRETPVMAQLPDGPVIVNAGQTGYFRTLYEGDALPPLAHGFRSLPVADQLGLVNDTVALGYAGYQPLADFMAVSAQATPDADPLVLRSIADQFSSMDNRYRGLPGQAAFRAHAIRLLQPVLAKLGWANRPDDSQNETFLRANLLITLGDFGDETVITEARRRFDDFVTDRSSLSSELRQIVLVIVSTSADAATWERLHQLAIATDNAVEKDQFYVALGWTKDRKLAERALQLALTDEAPTTTRPAIISAVAQQFPELAFDVSVSHRDAVIALLEPGALHRFFPNLLARANTAAALAKLDDYARDIPETAHQTVVTTQSAIRYTIEVREKRLPEVDHWLATAGVVQATTPVAAPAKR